MAGSRLGLALLCALALPVRARAAAAAASSGATRRGAAAVRLQRRPRALQAAPPASVLIMTKKGWSGVDFLVHALGNYSIPFATAVYDAPAAKPGLPSLLWAADGAPNFGGIIIYPQVCRPPRPQPAPAGSAAAAVRALQVAALVAVAAPAPHSCMSPIAARPCPGRCAGLPQPLRHRRPLGLPAPHRCAHRQVWRLVGRGAPAARRPAAPQRHSAADAAPPAAARSNSRPTPLTPAAQEHLHRVHPGPGTLRLPRAGRRERAPRQPHLYIGRAVLAGRAAGCLGLAEHVGPVPVRCFRLLPARPL
jgi:hypothetical protein